MKSFRLKYVHQFIDRHGHPRFYFRRPGFKQVALPGSPFSAEFMAAYTEAMASQPAPVTGGREVIPGTFNALAGSYLGFSTFQFAVTEHSIGLSERNRALPA
jgi:hypothetical protein